MTPVPPWRCPHCGAPQPETSRCWVCRRSTTCCATCRHFRRSIAPGLGFCGLDAKRTALTGDEVRGCWTTASGGSQAVVASAAPAEPVRTAPRQFVPVDELTPPRPRRSRPGKLPVAIDPATTAPVVPQEPGPDAGWSLWPEPDR